MIRNPLGLRLDPDRSVRDQIQQAARLGAKGVVLEAAGALLVRDDLQGSVLLLRAVDRCTAAHRFVPSPG